MTERTHARIPHLSEMGKVAPGPGHLRPEMRQDRGPPRGGVTFTTLQAPPLLAFVSSVDHTEHADECAQDSVRCWGYSGNLVSSFILSGGMFKTSGEVEFCECGK